MATMTVNQIILEALKLAGFLSPDDQPDANYIQQGLTSLNSLLDYFATSSAMIPLNKQINFSTVPGKARYTVSPTGTPDIISNKLLTIDFAVFRYLGMQYPLDINNDYQHFNRIRNNRVTGWPTEIYVRPLEFSSEIYIYYNPNNVYEVEVSGKFVLNNVELQTDLTAVPANYHRFLIYALAREFVSRYPGSTFEPTAEDEFQRMLSEIREGNQKDLTVVGDASLMYPGVYDATLFMGIGGAGGTDSNTSGAPSAAKYIIAQPNNNLPNAQSLSQLPSGLLKSQINTGVLNIAVPGIDYILPPSNTTPNTVARYGNNSQFLSSNVTLDENGNFGNVQTITGTVLSLSASSELRLNNMLFPTNSGLPGQAIGWVGPNQLGFINVSGGGAGSVTSVFGRTGAVVSQANDYSAAQVSFLPVGTISSTTVQNAIAEVSGDVTTTNTNVTNLSNSLATTNANLATTNTNVTNLTNSLATHVADDAAHNATSANTASRIVLRDASGNFSANIITANLNGNANTVTTNANLSGDVTSVGNVTAIAAGAIVDSDINVAANIAQSKIAGLAASLAAKQDISELNQPNGYCGLDATGKVALAQLPDSILGALVYQGAWNASTNTPTIPAASSSNAGWFYIVNVAGNTNIDGNSNWNVGDWIVSNGTTWDQVENASAVSSVFGRTGAVVSATGDYTASQITNVPAGSISATDVQSAITELDNEKQATITGAASTVTSANLTADLALIANNSGKIAVSGTTAIELSYLSGVTGSLQPQLNGKQATITGAATTITTANLTTSRALASDVNGKVAVSAVTSTELGYVSGVTSAIQTQLNAKQATITGGASTIATANLTASLALVSDTNGKVATSTVTATELDYVSGVTSNIQTQLNAKGPAITGAASTIATADLTVNRALLSDTDGKVGVSAVTSAELGYVSGVTSAIQTQLNGKQATITGGASSIATTNLGLNFALVSNNNGKVAVSTVTSTELGYLSGVTSGIQGQINAKEDNITGGASTITSTNLAINRALLSNGSGKVAASVVTATELGFLSGIDSNVQTQLNAKAPLASPAFTGTPTAPTAAFGNDSTRIATTAYVRTFGAWQTPTLSNGWVNVGGNGSTLQYRFTPLGQVEIKGTITGGTAPAIFTMPVAYRPAKVCTLSICAGASTPYPNIQLRIDNVTGIVQATPVNSGNEYSIFVTYSLDI